MRIESVRIESFRSFEDATIPFNRYACLVGPNGAGKSTVLTALNVFFRETENLPTDLSQLQQEDFHCKNTETPIRITVTFCDLSDEAQDDFSDYVRQGRLIVTAAATFDKGSGTAQVKQYGQRLGMTALSPFFEALDEGKKVGELKDIYSALRETYQDLPKPGTKEAMATLCEVTKPIGRMSVNLSPVRISFTVSREGRTASHQGMCSGFMCQPLRMRLPNRWRPGTRRWENCLPVPFVHKRISTRRSGCCARRCNNNIKSFSTAIKVSLMTSHSALQTRIAEWAHPDARLRLQWKQDPEKSVRVEEPWAHILAGEGDFEGELARFGHGLQRSYLLALLQELAGTDDATGPTLILACEEPELYQHPPQSPALGCSPQHSQPRQCAGDCLNSRSALRFRPRIRGCSHDPQGCWSTTFRSITYVIR